MEKLPDEVLAIIARKACSEYVQFWKIFNNVCKRFHNLIWQDGIGILPDNIIIDKWSASLLLKNHTRSITVYARKSLPQQKMPFVESISIYTNCHLPKNL